MHWDELSARTVLSPQHLKMGKTLARLMTVSILVIIVMVKNKVKRKSGVKVNITVCLALGDNFP